LSPISSRQLLGRLRPAGERFLPKLDSATRQQMLVPT
jgi:hypothetical protein